MSGSIRLKGATSGYIDITAPDSGANTTLNLGTLVAEDANGDVLIGGTTDRGRKFVVEGTGDLVALYSTNDGAGGAQLDFIQNSSSKAADDAVGIVNFSTDTRQFSSIRGIAHDHSNGYGLLRFGVRENTSTYNHDAMTLDQEGNLLVGTTNSNPTSAAVNDAGVELSNTGGVRSTIASNAAATFNRKTDDGAVVLIRKDGSTKANIGINSGDEPYFARNVGTTSGIKIANGALYPCQSDGTNHDNAQNLGISTARWANLYLSGGAYIGGTVAANYLDDYEEGTWEPQLIGATSNPSVTYHTDTGGKYVKIGQLVYVTGTIRTTAISGGSGFIWIVNIPFGCATRSNGDNSDGVGIAQTNIWNGTSTEVPTFVKCKHNDSAFYVGRGSDTAVTNFLDVSDWGSTCMMTFTLVYHTN